MLLTDERLNEIGEFLRSRRSRLGPEECGLPKGPRRRTPGLRREEVASLADVSTEWYTRLEQGRNARASQEALERIARALRLSAVESSHLLRLSGYPTVTLGQQPPEHEAVTPELQRFLDQQMPFPAYLVGVRWDILAWNPAAELLWGDIGAMEGLERNCMFHIFLGERYPRILQDWDKHATACVATLRDQGTAVLDDPWFRELIDTLMSQSERFAELWQTRDIVPYLDGRKDYEIPEVGRLSFNYMALEVADATRSGLRLLVFMPLPDTDTEARLREFVSKMPV